MALGGRESVAVVFGRGVEGRKKALLRWAAMAARRESFFAFARRAVRALGVEVWGEKMVV